MRKIIWRQTSTAMSQLPWNPLCTPKQLDFFDVLVGGFNHFDFP
jgi:hypothetical protein